MPVYEIGLDDGRKLRIDAENQEAALAGVEHFKSQEAAPKEEPSVAADLAMQAPTGFNEGLANTVGAPVDAMTWALNKGIHGINAAAEAAGLTRRKLSDLVTNQPAAPLINDIQNPVGGSQSIKNAMGYIGINPDNAPAKTGAGRYMRAATNAAASTILPEAAVAGAVRSGVAVPQVVQAALGNGSNMTRTAVSGAASGLGAEAASDATDGNPLATAVGGMVTGVLPGAVKDKIAARRAMKALPPDMTSEQVRQTAKTGYQDPELENGIVDPNGIATMAQNARQDLINKRFRPEYAGKEVFHELDALANQNAPTSIADLHALRMHLGELGKPTQDFYPTRDAKAAQLAKQHLDNYLNNITPADVISGDPQKAVSILRNADADYGAARRAQDVENRMGNAAIANAVTNSGLSAAQKTRQALAVLEKNQGVKSRAYDPAEKALLHDLVHGDAIDNTARGLSNIAGGGGGIGAGFVAKGAAALAHAVGLGPAASALVGAIVPAAGSGTRMFMSARTLRKANALRDQLLSRSPTYAAAQANKQAAVNAIKSTVRSNRATDATRAAVVQGLLAKYGQ